jgi:hypothetical protein
MGIVVKKSSETGFSEGWHEVTIENAVVGDYNDSRYIDLHFEGYPESLKCRVWEARNQEGEEFSISNMVRYSNPDILEELTTDGQLSANLDDSPAGLKGKKLQVLFYKKDNGYTEIFQKTAPAAPFENIIDNFNEERILKIKTSAEAYKAKRDAKASETTVNSEQTSETAAY